MKLNEPQDYANDGGCPQLHEDLGRFVVAAFIAWGMRIGMDYALKRYVADQPVPRWARVVARYIWRDWQKRRSIPALRDLTRAKRVRERLARQGRRGVPQPGPRTHPPIARKTRPEVR